MTVNPDDELERALAAVLARRDGIPLDRARHLVDAAFAKLELDLGLDLATIASVEGELDEDPLERLVDAVVDAAGAAVALLGPPLPTVQNVLDAVWLAGEAIRAAGGWLGELVFRSLTRPA